MLDVISSNASPTRGGGAHPSLSVTEIQHGCNHNTAGGLRYHRDSVSSKPSFKYFKDVEQVEVDNQEPTTTSTSATLAAKATDERERDFRRSRPSLFLLFIAVGNIIVVHSELVCYAILIVNHMRSANVLSMVYPLMVFLWGMLSVPRPTKNFWITLITYTEVSIHGIS